MKTLVLVRHAKSSWDNMDQEDIDRPLNDRGKKDAPDMAKRLKDKGIKADVFVSSPAKRARRTAVFFAEELGGKKDDITLVDELYMAAPSSFERVISSLPDKYDTAVVFGHNPGITEFVNTLTNVKVDDMPTCAVFAVSGDTDKWGTFRASDKKFLFFDYPKNPLG
jgi:phosphohistidine phosphatase